MKSEVKEMQITTMTLFCKMSYIKYSEKKFLLYLLIKVYTFAVLDLHALNNDEYYSHLNYLNR
jgi:hypothetical protein